MPRVTVDGTGPVLKAYLALPIVHRALVPDEDGRLWLIEARRDPETGMVFRRNVPMGEPIEEVDTAA